MKKGKRGGVMVVSYEDKGRPRLDIRLFFFVWEGVRREEGEKQVRVSA